MPSLDRRTQEAAKAQRQALEGAKTAAEGSVAALGQEIAAAKQAVGDLEAEAADVEDKAKAVNLSSREQVRARAWMVAPRVAAARRHDIAWRGEVVCVSTISLTMDAPTALFCT